MQSTSENRNLAWGDRSNDSRLSENFAWLLDLDDKDADALATVYKAPEKPELGFHWAVYLETGDVEGYANSLEAGKRACEAALSLPVCAQHAPIEK